MAKLLRQNAFVARRSVLLWLLCIGMFAMSVMARAEYSNIMNIAPGLGFVYAFIAAVYLGDAGTSGRLDSQIIVGAPRFQIYLSSWLTLTGCCILILLASLAGDLAGTPLALREGTADFEIWGWMVYVLSMILNAAAYAALFVFIGMLLTSRRAGRGTVTLIVCTVIVLAMAIGVQVLDNALREPKYYIETPVAGTEASFMTAVDEADLAQYAPEDVIANEDYIDEPQRTAYWNVLQAVPLSQAILMMDLPGSEPTSEVMQLIFPIWLYSGVLIVLTSALGMLLFQRRELD